MSVFLSVMVMGKWSEELITERGSDMICMLSTMFRCVVIARSMTDPDSSRVGTLYVVVNMLLMSVRWGMRA